MKKQLNYKNIFTETLILTGAIAIISAAVYFFLVPSHTSVSSISGLGIILSNFVPLPLSAITMILNVILLIIPQFLQFNCFSGIHAFSFFAYNTNTACLFSFPHRNAFQSHLSSLFLPLYIFYRVPAVSFFLKWKNNCNTELHYGWAQPTLHTYLTRLVKKGNSSFGRKGL